MKYAIYILVFALFVSPVLACERSVVRGNVENPISGMDVTFYCNDVYWSIKDIITTSGNYQRTSSYCDGELRGVLHIGENIIAEEIATKSGECNFRLDFPGVVQVPFFGAFGGVLSLAGVGWYYMKKKKE